jgi:hypothetical protein
MIWNKLLQSVLVLEIDIQMVKVRESAVLLWRLAIRLWQLAKVTLLLAACLLPWVGVELPLGEWELAVWLEQAP